MENEISTLEKRFNKYIIKVKNINIINNDNKLLLYANYKQSLFGDNTSEKPLFYKIIEVAKWKAWNEILGKPKNESMKDYIKIVKSLLNSSEI